MWSKKKKAQAMIEYLIIASALTFSAFYTLNDLNIESVIQSRKVKILDRLHQPIP
jgi:hypothetical protein